METVKALKVRHSNPRLVALEAYTRLDSPTRGRPVGPNTGKSGMIVVQPLKKSEMQPSYAQDMGTSTVCVPPAFITLFCSSTLRLTMAFTDP